MGRCQNLDPWQLILSVMLALCQVHGIFSGCLLDPTRVWFMPPNAQHSTPPNFSFGEHEDVVVEPFRRPAGVLVVSSKPIHHEMRNIDSIGHES